MWILRWFLVGFSLAFFFFFDEDEGSGGDPENEEQIHEIRQFVLALSIDRPFFPSIYDAIRLFCLVLGFFSSRLHARQKARIILNNLEKYPMKMQAKLPGCREGGRGDRNCSRRYR